MTKEEIFKSTISNTDDEARFNCRQHWDSISKPLDGLGDFEEVICKISGILGSHKIESFKKAVVIMCADNGIVEEGVSQCGQENTLLVAKLLGKGVSSASTFARFANTDVVTIDVGINSSETIAGVHDCKVAMGTKNFLKESAMSQDECIRAINVGIDVVRKLRSEGYNLVATGEMGIGNTTTGTALLCALAGMDPMEVTGRGAGLSDEGLTNKKRVITEGLRKHDLFRGVHTGEISVCTDANIDGVINDKNEQEYAFNALCAVGGLDIAALAGMYIGAAIYKMPIIIDGVISAAAALCANTIVPGCEAYMIPSHAGREAGVELALQELGLRAYINGDMALGEGCGALMLMPLLDMTLDFYNNATLFSEGNIDNYERMK